MNPSAPANHTPRVLSIVPGDGWYVVHNYSQWYLRARVVCIALLEWDDGTTTVEPIVPSDETDECVGPASAVYAQAGELEHTGELYCTCGAHPDFDRDDPLWCERRGAEIADAA